MNYLNTAVDSVLDRQHVYNTADAYYNGTIGEVFASAWYDRAFGRSFRNDYRLNFASTVVDAVSNRLELAAILGTSKKASDKINAIFEQNEMAIEANEIHKRALIYGECYVIVWPDDEGEIEISYNSPKTTALHYSNENQRKKEYAIKVWVEDNEDGTKRSRLNVYWPDRIDKYSMKGEITNGTKPTWTKIDTVDNPFGEIPVFHFRTSRPYGTPEHKRAYGPQDLVNKLVATHMTAVDYQGAPQRWAITAGDSDTEADAFDDDEAERANLDGLRNGPGELWYMKGVKSVGQFNPADHKSFTEPLSVYVRAMASSTDTPLHYFEKTGNVPSGEALRTAEAPLLKKVSDRQVAFGSTWRDIFRFALKIEGVNTDVQVKWMPVESMDSLDAWEVATKKKLVGVTPYQIFKEMGYDEKVAREMAAFTNAQVADSAQPGMNEHNLLLQQQAEARRTEADAPVDN